MRINPQAWYREEEKRYLFMGQSYKRRLGSSSSVWRCLDDVDVSSQIKAANDITIYNILQNMFQLKNIYLYSYQYQK